MGGRIEPFYKEVSDPVGEMKSRYTDCVQSAVTEACVEMLMKDISMKSCEGGLPGGGDT